MYGSCFALLQGSACPGGCAYCPAENEWLRQTEEPMRRVGMWGEESKVTYALDMNNKLCTGGYQPIVSCRYCTVTVEMWDREPNRCCST